MEAGGSYPGQGGTQKPDCYNRSRSSKSRLCFTTPSNNKLSPERVPKKKEATFHLCDAHLDWLANRDNNGNKRTVTSSQFEEIDGPHVHQLS